MSSLRIPALLAACACVAILGAHNSASAYVQQRSSTTGVPLKWTKLPVRFNINTRAAKGVTNAQIAAAVRAAYAAWTAPSCTNVTVQDTGSTQSDGNRQDSVNTNSWLTGWPAEYGSSTLGLTLTIYNPQSGSINDADTVYNPNYTWSTSGSQFAIDVQSVATHEIGHQLGLDHTPITSATMFRSTGQGDTSQRSLHSDDIQGICGIYPSGQGGTTPECTTKAQCAPNEDCVSGKCVTTGTKGYGGPCDAADACNSGICLRSNGVQVCTQLCEQQACPNGDQCVSVSSSTGQTTKACLPGTAQTGTKDLGDACTSNNDCKTEICVSVPGSGYLCSKNCTVGSADCGSGYRCAPANVGGLCVPDAGGSTNPTTPQTKKQLGDGCATHAECESGLCGSTSAGKACTQYCSSADPCPTGYSCASVKDSDKGACIASGPTPGALGAGCTKNEDCNSKICGSGGDGSRYCTELCQPTSGCPGAFDCVPAGSGKYACAAQAGSNPNNNGESGGGCTYGSSPASASSLSAAPFVPVALGLLGLLLLAIPRRRRA